MKRTLAMLLAVLMLFSLLPAQVFAEETVPLETTSQETEAAETTEQTAAETAAEETVETVAETAAAETEAAVETIPEETTETAAETEPAQTEEAVAEEATEAAEEEPAETIQETLPEVYLEVSDEAENGTTLYWPVIGGYYTQGYRPSNNYDHDAIDIGKGEGAIIVAPIGGTVYKVYNWCTVNHYESNGDCDGFGTGLVIRGDDNRYYQFAHMQGNSIPAEIQYEGARVYAGQQIGCMGQTGNANGPHQIGRAHV